MSIQIEKKEYQLVIIDNWVYYRFSPSIWYETIGGALVLLPYTRTVELKYQDYISKEGNK